MIRTIAKHYIHVDNGGYTFSVNEEDGEAFIECNTSFYDYSETRVFMNKKITPAALNDISNFFSSAAKTLYEENLLKLQKEKMEAEKKTQTNEIAESSPG